MTKRRVVTVHEAKTHLSRLLTDVEAGEEVIIARGSVPVARLVAEVRRQGREFGSLRGSLALPDSLFFDPLPEAELDAWEE